MNEDILYNKDAELCVLYAMIFDTEALEHCLSTVSTEDFYFTPNRLCFEAIQTLVKKNQVVDLLTIANELTYKNQYAQIGGAEYLTELGSSFGTTVHFKQYVPILKQKTFRRKALAMSQEIYHSVMNGDDSAVLKSVENRPAMNTPGEVRKISDVLIDALAEIKQTKESGKKFMGLETHFTDLDYATGGLQNTNLIIVAGRPSMGKTAFVMNIIRNTAPVLKQERKLSVFFSIEMGGKEISLRLFSTEANIPSDKFRLNSLNADDWFQMEQSATTFEDTFDDTVIVDDRSWITVEQIKATLYTLRAKFGKEIGLVCIDYLQLIHSEHPVNNKNQEITEISRGLKGIAKEFNCPLVALSQLSRSCDSRPDHRPVLSDLRESGAIEQDADVVAFLYRDEYYHPDTEKKGIAQVIIAKQRNGKTGCVDLAFDAKRVAFKNLVWPSVVI